MFSTTTIESSTSSPSAMTMPTMVIWLSVKPVALSAVRPIASESGMEIITTRAAGRPSGSRVSNTRAMAMRKSSPSRSSRFDTFRAWSKPRTSRMSRGRSRSNGSSSRSMRSRTAWTVVPFCWLAVTNTARWPLNRAR